MQGKEHEPITLPGSILGPEASNFHLLAKWLFLAGVLPGDSNLWEAGQGLSTVVLVTGKAAGEEVKPIRPWNREENLNIRQEEDKGAKDLLEKWSRHTWECSCCALYAFSVVLLRV